MRQDLEKVRKMPWVREQELADDANKQNHEDGALVADQGRISCVLHEGAHYHAQTDLINVPDCQNPECQA